MNIRIIAGLGMFLLAAGLIFIWYLDQQTAGEPVVVVEATPVPMRRVPGLVASPGPADVDSFLTVYETRYQQLRATALDADWTAAVDPNRTADRQRTAAVRSLGDFTSSREVSRPLERLRRRPDLGGLQDRQLEVAWRLAARRPWAWPELAARIAATDAALRDSLRHHVPVLRLPGEDPRTAPVATLDSLLAAADDVERRRALWESGQVVGAGLKEDLADLRDLRNRAARETGFSSWFGLQAADQGLTSDELGGLLQHVMDDLMPLYRQLHCWVRYELAARHGVEPPARIPIHWLNDRSGASWSGVLDAGPAVTTIQPSWLVDRAAEFWESLGFAPLPDSFLLRVDGSGTAATWHVDLELDVRTLLPVVADRRGLRAAHGQLGLAHAFLATVQPEVPLLLRGPADGSIEAGLIALGGLITDQPPYRERLAWPGSADPPDEVQRLLREALDGPVVLIPFLAGTVAGWEYDVYEKDLPAHRFNSRWWDLAGARQGLAPPTLRGEEWCDPAVLPPVIETPGAGWQRALGELVAHQLHRYACRTLLEQDLRSADYFGSREVGRLLQDIMALGRTRDGLLIVRQATGEDLSAAALLEYYDPLMTWLETANAGRDVGF